jgi:uncharacterized protein (DUF2249 family)
MSVALYQRSGTGIFELVGQLTVGGSSVLVNDHDPKQP